jgi:hypothetical protein
MMDGPKLTSCVLRPIGFTAWLRWSLRKTTDQYTVHCSATSTYYLIRPSAVRVQLIWASFVLNYTEAHFLAHRCAKRWFWVLFGTTSMLIKAWPVFSSHSGNAHKLLMKLLIFTTNNIVINKVFVVPPLVLMIWSDRVLSEFHWSERAVFSITPRPIFWHIVVQKDGSWCCSAGLLGC